MRNFNLVGAFALLVASAVSAEEEYNMHMPCFNDICWTSWRCWYSRYSKYDAELDSRCNVPDNVYRPGHDGAQWNTLVWGQHYRMEWKPSYESQQEDIILEWLMFDAPGTEKPVLPNERDMFLDYRGKGPERFVVALSQNISAAVIVNYFTPSLSNFPNEHLNVSSTRVTGYAMQRNVFRLYHPKTFNPHNSTTWDLSEPFTVIRPEDEAMIKKAVSNQREVDNKKLAIGVSVGVIVAWFVAFLVSWYTSAWFERKSLEKKGVLLGSAHAD